MRVGGARTGSPRPRRRAAGAAEAAEAPNLGDQKGGRRRRCGRRFCDAADASESRAGKVLASSSQNGVSGDSWPHRQPSPAPRLASSRGGDVLVLFQSVSSALGPGISPFVWLKKKKKKKAKREPPKSPSQNPPWSIFAPVWFCVMVLRGVIESVMLCNRTNLSNNG